MKKESKSSSTSSSFVLPVSSPLFLTDFSQFYIFNPMFDSQICRASFYGRDENTVAMSQSSSEPSLKVSSSQRSRGWGASVRCKPHLQSQFAVWCFSESVPTPRAPPASVQLWASGLIYVDGLTLNHNMSSCWRCTLCRCQQETLTREELWISCQWLLLLGGQWSDWLSEVAGEGEWVVRGGIAPWGEEHLPPSLICYFLRAAGQWLSAPQPRSQIQRIWTHWSCYSTAVEAKHWLNLDLWFT